MTEADSSPCNDSSTGSSGNTPKQTPNPAGPGAPSDIRSDGAGTYNPASQSPAKSTTSSKLTGSTSEPDGVSSSRRATIKSSPTNGARASHKLPGVPYSCDCQ